MVSKAYGVRAHGASEPIQRRERAAVLSVYAAVMGVVLVIMGISYLGATMRSVQATKAREHQAMARAAARGAVRLALKTVAPTIGAGQQREVTFTIGGLEVPTIVSSKQGAIVVQAKSVSVWGKDLSTAGFVCEAKLEGGKVRVLRMQPSH